jgi:hypothetical protein
MSNMVQHLLHHFIDHAYSSIVNILNLHYNIHHGRENIYYVFAMYAKFRIHAVDSTDTPFIGIAQIYSWSQGLKSGYFR